jgi:hypothetical protein
MELVEINVNELVEAIGQYKGVKVDMIRKVEVANILNQHHPRTVDINAGGVLTIFYSVEEKEEG